MSQELEKQFPETPLLPDNTDHRAEVEEVCRHASGHPPSYLSLPFWTSHAVSCCGINNPTVSMSESSHQAPMSITCSLSVEKWCRSY